MTATASTTRVLLVADDVRYEVETVCEPINEWLSITPYVGAMRDGKVQLSGGFAVTHIPTGYAASRGFGCIDCARRLGALLAQLDWSSAPTLIDERAYTRWLREHPAPLVDEISQSLDLSSTCYADDCSREVS